MRCKDVQGNLNPGPVLREAATISSWQSSSGQLSPDPFLFLWQTDYSMNEQQTQQLSARSSQLLLGQLFKAV